MLITSLSFIVSFPVSAAGNTKMGCVISEGEVTVGDTFNVTVWLNASEPVDSWWVGQLSFNSAVLGMVTVDSVSIDPYWTSGFYDNGTIHNNTGNITGIQAFIMSNSTTNTTIFNVSFTAVKPGTCYIKLTEAEAYSGGPNVLSTTYNTSIVIKSGSYSPPYHPPSTNQNPLANAGGPYESSVYQLITFDGSESSDSDGTITGYRWDFDNDGTYDTDWLTISTTTHAYSTAGTYTVKLQVKDNAGATATNTTTATINEQSETSPPIATTNGPYTGLTYQNISFDGSNSYDTDGTITSYTWDFGDGTAGNGINPIHIYNTSGLYNITLTVTDNDDLTNSSKTTAMILLDSDRDGWSDNIEESYGTNATNPLDQPTDTDGDGIPDNGSPDSKYTGDTDDDNDGLDDVIENQLGSDSKNKSDVKNIDDAIAGGYLVDTDGNGQYDTFYNSKSSVDTKIEVTDTGTYLIDTDGDGKWNYIYKPSSGDVTSYKEKSSEGVPWVIIIVISVVAIIVIIVILFKTGYIYIENVPPTETEKNKEEKKDKQK